MARMSTPIRWFAALLVAALMTADVGCKHMPPIVEPVITCGGDVVTQDNVRRIERDLRNMDGGGEADLLSWLLQVGPAFIGCLIDWYVENGSADQKAAATRFKVGHKAELSRPVSSLLFLPSAPPGKGPGLVGGGGG